MDKHSHKYTNIYQNREIFSKLAENLRIPKKRSSFFSSFWENLENYLMVMQSQWKFQMEIDFLEYLATQLKVFVAFKDRNVFNLYVEAPKRPNPRLLRVSLPWLRRPSKT